MNQEKEERKQQFIQKSKIRRAKLQRALESERDLFVEFMFLLFLGLKLHGSIDWSWWIVPAPLYWHYFTQLYKIENEERLIKKMAEEERQRRGLQMVEDEKAKRITGKKRR